jgi:hypothetical protein
MIFRWVLGALLLLGAASPAAAQTRFYNFTWSAHTTGHSTQDGSPSSEGDTTGWGIMRLVSSTVEPGRIDVTFTGPGGSGGGFFDPPGSTSPDRGVGMIDFPGRTDSEGTTSAPASLKFFGQTFTSPSQFIINGFTASQGGVNSFWGAANPLTAAIASPLWGASVSGTVNVGMAAGLPGVPLNYQLFVDNTQVFNQTVSAGSASFAWNTNGTASGSHTLSFGVFATDGTLIDSASIPVNVTNLAAPLTASIPSPTEGSTVSNTATVSMAASGAAPGTLTFTLFVDTTPVFTGSTSGGGAAFDWNTRTVADGAHTLRVDVRDSAGRTATTSRKVTVANWTTTGLKVIFTRPAEEATLGGTIWVDIWVEGASGTSNTFVLAVDGTVVARQTTSGVHVTLAWSSLNFPNGLRSMTARVTDATGKTGSASRTVNVKN